MNLLGAYRPGDSWLHRLRPGTKLIGLAVLSIGAVVWRTPTSTAVLLAATAVGYVTSGVGLRSLARALRRVLVVVAVVGAYQVWRHDPAQAFTITGNIAGLILAAALVSAVTPVDATIDTITTALGPLRRFGVRPERVALAFSLLMRAIPDTLATAGETRQAAIARGLDRSPRAHLGPLVIRLVARARLTGDALHARNLLDDPVAAGRGEQVAAAPTPEPGQPSTPATR
ncbi:MAG: energy-coupling factor transporter transmembrane component T family protein [Desertimonas sp.]